MKNISTIISYLLHPLVMPAAGLLVLFNSSTYLSYLPYDVKKVIFLIVILCTIIIPLSLVPFFLYQKLVMNVQITSRRERFVPMIAALLFFLFCYYLLKKIPVPPAYHSFILGSSVAVLLAVITTVYWKISAHMIGIGGLTGLISFLIWSLRVDLQFFLILAIMAAGLVGFARLQLKAHNPAQVYTGFLTGFFSVSLTMLFY
jgi:membrane-associated phospholipid phosphatase